MLDFFKQVDVLGDGLCIHITSIHFHWEVDNLDGCKGASFYAHAAADAEVLCNFANRRA